MNIKQHLLVSLSDQTGKSRYSGAPSHFMSRCLIAHKKNYFLLKKLKIYDLKHDIDQLELS